MAFLAKVVLVIIDLGGWPASVAAGLTFFPSSCIFHLLGLGSDSLEDFVSNRWPCLIQSRVSESGAQQIVATFLDFVPKVHGYLRLHHCLLSLSLSN